MSSHLETYENNSVNFEACDCQLISINLIMLFFSHLVASGCESVKSFSSIQVG